MAVGGTTAATPGGTVWAAATMDGSISRFDGETWQEFRPLGDDGTGTYRVFDVAAGDDGTVWALMSDMSDVYIARWGGSEWSTFLWDDMFAEAPSFPDDIGAVANDGSVYLAIPDSTANRTASIMAFDGDATTIMPGLEADVEETFDQIAALPTGDVLAAGQRGLHHVFRPIGG